MLLSALSGIFLYNSDFQLLEVTACLQYEVKFIRHCNVFNNNVRAYFPGEINEKPMQHYQYLTISSDNKIIWPNKGMDMCESNYHFIRNVI
jgi:hypothetical protein